MEKEAEIIYEWEKNKREKVRVSLSEYKGKKLLDIRVWYLDENNQYSPGKKGISLGLEQLPFLEEAIAKAKEKIKP